MPVNERITLTEMAEKMGVTEEKLKQLIEDTPRRHAETARRVCENPAYKAMLAKYDKWIPNART